MTCIFLYTWALLSKNLHWFGSELIQVHTGVTPGVTMHILGLRPGINLAVDSYFARTICTIFHHFNMSSDDGSSSGDALSDTADSDCDDNFDVNIECDLPLYLTCT